MSNSLTSSPCKDAGGKLYTAKAECEKLPAVAVSSIASGAASSIASGAHSLALRGLSAAKQVYNNGGKEMANKALAKLVDITGTTVEKVSSTKHQEEKAGG
jgi:hypothetical protein